MARTPNPTVPAPAEKPTSRELVSASGHVYKLHIAERNILDALGGKPWTLQDYRNSDVKAAKRAWQQLRTAVGFKGNTGWMTTERTSPKLGKAGIPSLGVTLHAAHGAADAWRSCSVEQRAAIAAAVGRTVDELTAVLAPTVCPYATRNCIAGCVVSQSHNATYANNVLVRLLRTVFVLARPADALTLTAHHLEQQLKAVGGNKDKARWRVNISDDIRWEAIAPGLFKVAPKAYTYTKWPVADRPAVKGLRIVYSATERWTDEQIAATCNAGHRVAVVLDMPKRKPLPATWRSLPVSDGDATDDLWTHPAGHVVALVVKGRNKDIKAQLAASGFARSL